MARQPEDPTAAKPAGSDSALIRELATLLDETRLTEIEIERAGLRVRVARNVSIAAAMPCSSRCMPRRRPPRPPHRPADIAEASRRRSIADGRHRLLGPEPGAKPFVEVGSRSRQARRC